MIDSYFCQSFNWFETDCATLADSLSTTLRKVSDTPSVVLRSIVDNDKGQSKTEIVGWKGAEDRARIFLIPHEILLRGPIDFSVRPKCI